MMIIDGEQLLAELHGGVAASWQAFADANHVSVSSLLNALGPILHNAESLGLDLGAALRQAVASAS